MDEADRRRSAVTQLREDPVARRSLVGEGRRTAESTYSWETVGAGLLRALEDVAGQRP